MIEQLNTSPVSEAGFQVLFENATIGILVINSRGTIELSNPCAEKLFGYEPKELIGQSVECLIPPPSRTRHITHRRNFFNHPKARPMGFGQELHALKKNSEVFPVEISLGYYTLGTHQLSVAFITDITQRVKARTMAVQRDELFKEISDHSPVMIWRTGRNKKCTFVNTAWLNFTGRRMNEEVGEGWTGIIHPEDRHLFLTLYANAYERKAVINQETRLRRHDGTYRWMRLSGNPSFSAEGIFAGYIGSCADVHDQRIAELEIERQVSLRTSSLQDALRREKEVTSLNSRFVSMASHEFRSPLSVILTSISLIEKYIGQEMEEKIEKHIGRIKSSLGGLRTILDDFLSIDKLEQGKVEISNDQFDIDEFLQKIVEDIFLFQKKGQSVRISHTGNKMVLLDQKKLGYILVNLISNSMKYSPEDSVIDLEVQVMDHAIKISVRDAGIGIPEEEQEFLFTKFFRARNTGNIQGTGLGLTIAKRYVELMNGNIACVSRPGSGTTFTIEMPQ